MQDGHLAIKLSSVDVVGAAPAAGVDVVGAAPAGAAGAAPACPLLR